VKVKEYNYTKRYFCIKRVTV